MAPQTPTIKVQISGDNLTTLSTSTQFDLENKTEKTFTINSVDLAKTVDTSNVENIKAIVFTGTGEFQVTFEKDAGSNIIDFIIDYSIPFVLPTTQAFIDSLDAIKFSTLSVDDIQISIKIYGEVVTS